MSLRLLLIVTMLVCNGYTVTHAAISDLTATDVSTRSAAFVWASNSPVNEATIKVFTDANGTQEVTSSFQISLLSTQFSPALANGIVKIDINGLEPATTYYVQTQTDNASGIELEPASAPFVAVTTASATTLADALNQSIVNDVLAVNVTAPDGFSTADGTLALFETTASAYPISAFVGEGFFSAQTVVADFSNVFDNSGQTVGLDDDAIITVSHFRGGLCAGNVQHKATHYARIPAQTEFPTVTNFASAAACYFADTFCDDTVDGFDVQLVLDAFRSMQGECAFNPDLDLSPDGTINVLDLQNLLNHFGESAPF